MKWKKGISTEKDLLRENRQQQRLCSYILYRFCMLKPKESAEDRSETEDYMTKDEKRKNGR